MGRHLLPREVKQDKNGLYISYGGYRFCPPDKSSAFLGLMVQMESSFRRTDNLTVVIVLRRKETWKHRRKPSKYSTRYGKTFRFTRSFYSGFCFAFSKIK